MTKETDRPDSPRTDPRRWREDPLSIFLGVAALLLALMYALEQRGLTTLEAANSSAHELAVSLALDGCTAGAASADGRTFVLECDRPAATIVDELDARAKDLAGFDAVVVAGPQELLRCALPSHELGRCARSQRPQRTDVSDAPKGSRPGN